MSLLKVRTAQNVHLEYIIGNIGQRILGAGIDQIVILFYYLSIWLAFLYVGGINLFDGAFGPYVIILIMLPPTFYLPVSEFFWNGRTVGKYALKLKVIKSDGSTASIGDLVLRWLLRTIDVKLGFLFIFFLPDNPNSDIEQYLYFWAVFFFIFPFPVIGIITMAMNPHQQRFGDIAANTVVIRNIRPFSLDDTILELTKEDYQPRYLNVLELRDKDIYIIKNALEHAKKNYDYKSLDPLAEKAREILNIDDHEKPLALLETILQDYNHLARKRDLVD